MKQVTIYSTATCQYCDLAKNYLDEKGVEYTEYKVDTDADKRKEMVEKTHQMGVPAIVVADDNGDERVIVGFNQPALDEALA